MPALNKPRIPAPTLIIELTLEGHSFWCGRSQQRAPPSVPRGGWLEGGVQWARRRSKRAYTCSAKVGWALHRHRNVTKGWARGFVPRPYLKFFQRYSADFAEPSHRWHRPKSVGYRFCFDGQGNWKWLAGAAQFQGMRRPHPRDRETQAQGPNGLACPGLTTGSPLSTATLSPKR
jgi:hypothetical protein